MLAKSYTDKAKALIWFFITPIHPYVRDLLLFFKIIRHDTKENYFIGYLIKEKSIGEFRDFLIRVKGFEERFARWVDKDEVINVRFRQNFQWQYHLRVYKDGEVRGHHEYTPEAKPIAHLFDKYSTPCVMEFMAFVEGWVEVVKKSKPG